jgi:hypothetical protein
VVGVHLRDHGKSPRSEVPFSFEDFILDGLSAVTYATERFGAGPRAVVNHRKRGPLAIDPS